MKKIILSLLVSSMLSILFFGCGEHGGTNSSLTPTTPSGSSPVRSTSGAVQYYFDAAWVAANHTSNDPPNTAEWRFPSVGADFTVEAIGEGGNGYSNNGACGGGGGGAYTKGHFYDPLPGSSISITIGQGGSGTDTIVMYHASIVAQHGESATNYTGASGGAASAPSQFVISSYAGGNGAAGSFPTGGGGGGGAAGPYAAGNNGLVGGSYRGGTGGEGDGTYGGLGGASDNRAGSAGLEWQLLNPPVGAGGGGGGAQTAECGGGGGGAYGGGGGGGTVNYSGGSGGSGLVVITYVPF